MTSADTPDLSRLRAEIDTVDAQLVALIARRAEAVASIGAAKRAAGMPVYAPDREREVVERAVSRNPGPISNATLETIFREIMSATFSLQLPLRVAYLGPPGSFSHLAAVRHFGSGVEHNELRTIRAVVESVARGHADHGLVPYENSIGGSIHETLDALATCESSVCGESLVNISQNLLANCAPEEIRSIHSKPEALDQCRGWLAAQFPRAELVGEASTSAAARKAATTPGVAAVGSELAAEVYGVRILFSAIQDRPENITRFLVLGSTQGKSTGEDRTTIYFTTLDRPGALVDVLDAFRREGVNLLHIDKRPSGRLNWEYAFFIDCAGHRDDTAVAKAIEGARAHCASLKVLGSYTRSRRIL